MSNKKTLALITWIKLKMPPTGGQINLIDLIFTSGTIEFDMQPIEAETGDLVQ